MAHNDLLTLTSQFTIQVPSNVAFHIRSAITYICSGIVNQVCHQVPKCEECRILCTSWSYESTYTPNQTDSNAARLGPPGHARHSECAFRVPWLLWSMYLFPERSLHGVMSGWRTRGEKPSCSLITRPRRSQYGQVMVVMGFYRLQSDSGRFFMYLSHTRAA